MWRCAVACLVLLSLVGHGMGFVPLCPEEPIATGVSNITASYVVGSHMGKDAIRFNIELAADGDAWAAIGLRGSENVAGGMRQLDIVSFDTDGRTGEYTVTSGYGAPTPARGSASFESIIAGPMTTNISYYRLMTTGNPTDFDFSPGAVINIAFAAGEGSISTWSGHTIFDRSAQDVRILTCGSQANAYCACLSTWSYNGSYYNDCQTTRDRPYPWCMVDDACTESLVGADPSITTNSTFRYTYCDTGLNPQIACTCAGACVNTTTPYCEVANPPCDAAPTPSPNQTAFMSCLPATGIPYTSVPHSATPPTSAPITTASKVPHSVAIPPSLVPTEVPTAIPSSVVVGLRLGGAVIEASAVRDGGARVVWGVEGGGFAWAAGTHVQVAVTWGGSHVVCRRRGVEAKRCGKGPCVVVATDMGVTENMEGLAGTVGRNRGAMQAWVGEEGSSLIIEVQDATFRAYAPHTEVLHITIHKDAFGYGVIERLMTGPQNGPATCNNSACTATYTLQAETPLLPNKEAVETTAVVTGLVTAIVAPVTPSSGLGLMRVSLLAKALNCPANAIEVARLVNPLGLHLGGDWRVSRVNGAVVVCTVLVSAVLLTAAACTAVAYCRTRGEIHTELAHELLANEDSPRDSNLTITDFAARGRAGWALIPITLLYGGVTMSSTAALLYSSVPYKILAGVDLMVVGVGLPVYLRHVAINIARHATPRAKRVDGSVKAFFWGRSVYDGESWHEVNKCAYGRYRWAEKGFLFKEMAFMGVLGVVAACEPTTQQWCQVKAGVLTCLIGGYVIVLATLRPFIAAFENASEVLIAMLELAMSLCITYAVSTRTPSEHGAAVHASRLAIAAQAAILVQYLIVISVYTHERIEAGDSFCGWRRVNPSTGSGKEKGTEMAELRV